MRKPSTRSLSGAEVQIRTFTPRDARPTGHMIKLFMREAGVSVEIDPECPFTRRLPARWRRPCTLTLQAREKADVRLLIIRAVIVHGDDD